MGVYKVVYYPIKGKYDTSIVDNCGPMLELNVVEFISDLNAYAIFIEKPTFAEAVAAASYKFLEEKIGCGAPMVDPSTCCDSAADMEVMLRILIDYFTGGAGGLETASDLEELLQSLRKQNMGV